MPVLWSIDGKRVKLLDDWEATSTAKGGYEQLTASAERTEILHAHQESYIIGTSGGSTVWAGTLDATPAASRLPVAKLTATGPVAKLRRQRSNWLAQSRDYDLIQAQDSDPYGYANSSSINFDASGGRLFWNIPNGTDIKTNNNSGGAVWFMGEPLTRVAFDWDSSAAATDLKLQVLTAPGPSGTRTQVGADISLNATSGSIDRAITGNDDLFNIRAQWTGANATTAASYKLRVVNLRINGRSGGDNVSPGDIIGDMASSVGLKTGKVRSSGQNALPFYWEGGSWGDAFDELSALDDWPWAVTRNGVEYGPWDTRWQIQFSQENEDLDWPPIYNWVRVFYTTLAGASRSVPVQASPDPLAKWGDIKEYQYDLGESYPDDKDPTAVANALLDKVSTQRVVGTVVIGRVAGTQSIFIEGKGPGLDAYRIQPGDLAKLKPYPKLEPQRIEGVRYRTDGVTLEFGEDAETAASRVLARIARSRARRRQRR
jgi:hypothetical protein